MLSAASLNFGDGIDAVDGGGGQANISANVGNGLKIVNDQIQPDYTTTATAGKVCEANDPRLSDSRTPLSHAATHQNGGTDEINVKGLSGELADAQKVAVQDEGQMVATRTQLNFTGTGVTVSDDAGNNRVNINVPGGGGQQMRWQKGVALMIQQQTVISVPNLLGTDNLVVSLSFDEKELWTSAPAVVEINAQFVRIAATATEFMQAYQGFIEYVFLELTGAPVGPPSLNATGNTYDPRKGVLTLKFNKDISKVDATRVGLGNEATVPPKSFFTLTPTELLSLDRNTVLFQLTGAHIETISAWQGLLFGLLASGAVTDFDGNVNEAMKAGQAISILQVA